MKNPCKYSAYRGFLWCGPGLNRRHMDFQSIALPTELPHLPSLLGQQKYGDFSEIESFLEKIYGSVKQKIRFHPFLTINLFIELIFQAGNINHKPVLHIAFHNPVVCFIDLIHRDDLHITGDIVFGTEIKHFLCFANAAN